MKRIILSMVLGLGASVCVADENAKWAQFGHARNWSVDWNIEDRPNLRLDWEQEVGEGQSQIVGGSEQIYVASGGKVKNGSGKQIETVLSARSTKTGELLWAFRHESEMSPNQETFGGNKPTPQATPLVASNRIVLMTFTGQLFCLDADSGKELWSKDLQQETGAQAVQFGFSSSIVLSPTDSSQILVFAAGEKGGLLNLKLESGEPNWIAPVASFSYATPSLVQIDGLKQWLAVSREYVLGIDDKDGKVIWKFDLKEKGLTNVPSPLWVSDGQILVSGQGCKGTLCLTIARSGNDWTAKETWFNPRLQFFTTNWLMLDETTALGCTDKLLTAVDCVSGKQLGRWRGFAEGNILKAGSQFLILSGKGDLSVLAFDDGTRQLLIQHKFRIGQGRFWTAPSVIGDRLLIRVGKTLKCLSFQAKKSARDIPNRIEQVSEKVLQIEKASAPAKQDPVELIFQEFQANGQDAAMKIYSGLRRDMQLSAEQRIELAEAAYGQGLQDVAYVIMEHAAQDLPDSELVREKLKQWGGK